MNLYFMQTLFDWIVKHINYLSRLASFLFVILILLLETWQSAASLACLAENKKREKKTLLVETVRPGKKIIQ